MRSTGRMHCRCMIYVQDDLGGFMLSISRAVLTYRPVLHCRSLVDPSKSRIRKVKCTDTFTYPLFLTYRHTKKRERVKELPLAAACLLSMPKPQTPSLSSLLELHGFLGLCALSGISHFPACHLTWLNQLPAIK